MLSIIIPAFNEEQTIEKTVKTARKAFFKAEIIVVDDGSTDKTYEKIPKKYVNKIIRQKNSGKGSAMKTGVGAVTNENILFLDADIRNLSVSMLRKLANPILKNKTDVVIGYFTSPYFQGFTELLYKPLMKLLFPEVEAEINKSPLSGQRGIKRQVLKKLSLEKNFGVEVGMNIDLVMKTRCRINNVSLGKLNTTFKGVGKTRGPEILNTIIKKAKEYNRLSRLKKSNFILLSEILRNFLINVKKNL